MKVVYRISDKEKRTGKPAYVTQENCLRNFLSVFLSGAGADPRFRLTVVADNVEDTTYEWLCSECGPDSTVVRTSLGNGLSFLRCLELAVKDEDPDELVYFVESDYIHRPGAPAALREAAARFDYVTLYDHPDKYVHGPNPLVHADGGEVTKVFLTESCHWKLTNSTCMTFASRVRTLREDAAVFRKYCETPGRPADFELFCELCKARRLVSSIPGFATHGETAWLAPLIPWEEIAESSA